MNYFKLKFLLLFFALAVAIPPAWAGEESVTFSEQGYSNEEVITSYVGTNFSISFDKGTNKNAPKYFTSGTAIRIYGGNSMTVSSTKTITEIVITFGSSDGSNAITTDVGTYNNGTWTGSSNSVKSEAHLVIDALQVLRSPIPRVVTHLLLRRTSTKRLLMLANSLQTRPTSSLTKAPTLVWALLTTIDMELLSLA